MSEDNNKIRKEKAIEQLRDNTTTDFLVLAAETEHGEGTFSMKMHTFVSDKIDSSFVMQMYTAFMARQIFLLSQQENDSSNLIDLSERAVQSFQNNLYDALEELNKNNGGQVNG